MRRYLAICALLPALGSALPATGATHAPAQVLAEEAATVHAVDVRASHASFSVAHIYVSNVSGTVPIVSGSVTLPVSASAIPTQLSAKLDPRGISSGDGDRDADLQGPDWFDVKQFATWTYSSSSIVRKSDNAFTVNGTLTVHGVAQPVVLDVTVVRGLPKPRYHATGHAIRRGFGMHVTPTDALIGNDISLALDVELQ